MNGLTAKQRETLDAITAFRDCHGYPPTIRELAAIMGVSSPSTVQLRVTALERKGYLRRERGKNRAMAVIQAEGRG